MDKTVLLDGWFFEHLKQDNKRKLFQRIPAKLWRVKYKCWVDPTGAECEMHIQWWEWNTQCGTPQADNRNLYEGRILSQSVWPKIAPGLNKKAKFLENKNPKTWGFSMCPSLGKGQALTSSIRRCMVESGLCALRLQRTCYSLYTKGSVTVLKFITVLWQIFEAMSPLPWILCSIKSLMPNSSGYWAADKGLDKDFWLLIYCPCHYCVMLQTGNTKYKWWE